MNAKSKTAPKWMSSAKKPEVSSNKLDEIRKVVKEARDLEIQVSDLSSRTGEMKKKLTEIEMKKLPELMEGAGMSAITIDADGNLPAYEAKAKAYYSAGIRPDWPEEDRERAFAYLKSIGHDELIKVSITYDFPKDTPNAVIDKFMKEIRKIKLGTAKKPVKVPPAQIERGVHTATLTAWLKDQIENEGFMPQLDLIGGFVGKKVTVKEVKEKAPRTNKTKSE